MLFRIGSNDGDAFEREINRRAESVGMSPDRFAAALAISEANARQDVKAAEHARAVAEARREGEALARQLEQRAQQRQARIEDAAAREGITPRQWMRENAPALLDHDDF